MISCLIDYIGLRSVTDGVSGRTVNELPGIITEQIDQSRATELYNTETAWNEIQDRAIRKFEKQLNTWAVKYYDNYSYMDSEVTGQIDTNTDIASLDVLQGWMFDSFASQWKNMKLILQFAEVYARQAVSSKIYVYNATTGDKLSETSHDFTIGLNRIMLRKEYPFWKYPKLFIGYDASEVQSKQFSDLTFSDSINVAKKQVSKSAAVVDANLTAAAPVGMALSFSVECSLDNYVCQRIALFEEPFMYMLGIEFCNEIIFSNRLNRYTLLDREEAEKLRDYLKEEQESQLKGVLTGLRMRNNDYCFNCAGAVTNKILLP
jgi:hypothetical protein